MKITPITPVWHIVVDFDSGQSEHEIYDILNNLGAAGCNAHEGRYSVDFSCEAKTSREAIARVGDILFSVNFKMSNISFHVEGMVG